MNKFKSKELSYKKIAIIFVVFLIIVTACIFLITTNKQTNKSSAQTVNYTSATVIKVTDGDTIWVKYDGHKKKVRLIGINCPEISFYSNTQDNSAGKQAADYTKSILSTGQTIYLQKDVSETDNYDRLLRYIWLEKPADSNKDDEIRNKMVNAMIVLNGYAEAKEYAPDTKYSDKFSKYESEAKKQKIGIWTLSQE